MRKYFNYQFKKSLVVFALLALACTVISVFPVVVENYDFWNARPDAGYVDLYSQNALIVLIIACFAAPIFFFSYKMKERSVDMYYALPISRTKIAAVHFICGFICVYAAFSVGYLLNFLMVVIKVRRLLYINYLWLYLASFIPALSLYTLSAFCYTRANAVVDGIVFILAGTFALTIVYAIFHTIGVADKGVGSMPVVDGFFPWTCFERIINCIAPRIYGRAGDKWFLRTAFYTQRMYAKDVSELVGVIAITVLSIAAGLGLFFTEKRCKAESCGQVSNGIFGYKVYIPLYILSFCMICGNEVFMLCLIALGAVATTMVYRRTAKLSKKQIILLAIYVVISILCGVLANWRYWS